MRIDIDQAALARFIVEHRHRALSHYSEPVADRARDGAPFDTGDLQESIEIDKSDEERGIHYVGSELPYASVAEFGMRQDGTYRWKTGPTNFLRNALYREEGAEE